MCDKEKKNDLEAKIVPNLTYHGRCERCRNHNPPFFNFHCWFTSVSGKTCKPTEIFCLTCCQEFINIFSAVPDSEVEVRQDDKVIFSSIKPKPKA